MAWLLRWLKDKVTYILSNQNKKSQKSFGYYLLFGNLYVTIKVTKKEVVVMEKITGKVRLQYKGERRTFDYEIDEGYLIHIKDGIELPEQLYSKVWEKIYDKHIDLYKSQEYYDYVSHNSNENKSDKVTKIQKGTKKEKETEMKKEPDQNDPEKEKLLKRIKELEEANERLKERRGGRPAIGETRKVSLTLPTHIWSDIDAAVRVGKVKQSSVLREMIVRAHESDLLFWKEVRER
ncbi:hypothetical protein NDK47_27600 (plasmid) [Brevibacillus ruminantium]|uniref:Ribbon-helix-helix protein CopG domain-containing protein n=1 Tax=Brevibacillus ruminantium TaxID=2950604 RepID=A0ABY4WNA2_9BACL|nr:hypothetical protein [Brevibacillus ruminantium]USG68553.1 hypothetical protein NDK47_27600 [Brevibacillus ruminantium]